MDREAYAAYINSSRWKARRLRFIASAGARCACGSSKRLHVHHVTYERFTRELDADLRVVCHSCHEMIHRYHRDSGGSLREATDRIIEAWSLPRVHTDPRPTKEHKRPTVVDWRKEIRRPSWIKTKGAAQ